MCIFKSILVFPISIQLVKKGYFIDKPFFMEYIMIYTNKLTF